eukprot:26725-Pyramimonas_sp.AAC.1
MLRTADSSMSSPHPTWPLRAADSYHQSCAACEVGSPPQKIGGRLVVTGHTVNGVVLNVGDRLVPSSALLDIAAVETRELPRRVTLWRARLDHDGRVMDPVNGRCPIFSRAIGTSPYHNLAVDSLHTIFLGVAMRWMSAALWRLALTNPWNVKGSLEQALPIIVTMIKLDMDKWVRDPANQVPSGRCPGHLSVKMLGKRRGFTFQDSFVSYHLYLIDRHIDAMMYRIVIGWGMMDDGGLSDDEKRGIGMGGGGGLELKEPMGAVLASRARAIGDRSGHLVPTRDQMTEP